MTRNFGTACALSCVVAPLLFAGGGLIASCSQNPRGSGAPLASGGSGAQEQGGGAGEAIVGAGGEADAESDSGNEEDAPADADGPCVPPDAAIASPPMVDVPAGDFMMGCNAAIDEACEPSERPFHKVTLSGFRIDRHEVTMADYSACVSFCVCSLPEESFDPIGLPDNPVVGVSLDQAGTYCTWLGRRLPTEAEWEKAARGTDGRIYPWGNAPPTCDRAAYLACAWDGKSGVTFPVGTFSPKGDSPWGAQDMAGNVWEWVSDWYAPYDGDASVDPEGPPSSGMRVWRGGSYLHDSKFLRTSTRFPYGVSQYHALGIRCAQSL